MPRLRRIDYPGAWHHVMNRGVAGGRIFNDEIDRQRYLEFLVEAAERAAVECHAYCLMGNHVHLLLQSTTGRLSEAMQCVSARYTQAFNRRHRRDGPLFRGRYRSVLIESDAQLFSTQGYIHGNPVVAGLCRAAPMWPWSSAQFYFGDPAPPRWLSTAVVSEILKDRLEWGQGVGFELGVGSAPPNGV